MTEYTLSQIKGMQNEATARVRQMHEKARDKVEKHNEAVRESHTDNNEKKPSDGLFNFKKLLSADGDRALILCLILLLYGSCDEMLLLALIYIML